MAKRVKRRGENAALVSRDAKEMVLSFIFLGVAGYFAVN